MGFDAAKVEQQADERLFGMEAQFWLNLQLAWDLSQVLHSPATVEIAKMQRWLALVTDPASA